MDRRQSLFFSLGMLALLSFGGCGLYLGQRGDFTGIDSVGPRLMTSINQDVRGYLAHYDYISIALVYNGEIVLTKSYGHDRIVRNDVYASVSKPVTSTIVVRLREDGQIKSLDDPIGKYSRKYRDVQPQEFSDPPITFRHLLTHTGGVPHQSALWEDDTLNMDFRAGTGARYSTKGYGILGDVMEDITGKSYEELVQEYIGGPVGASSFTALPFFEAPAGNVYSTIADMARFAIGVMSGQYYGTDVLFNEILIRYADEQYGVMGLGWYVLNLDDPENLAGYHAGSNGRPRAFLAIKPRRQNAVCITGLNTSSDGAHDFGNLAIDLMKTLETGMPEYE